MASIKNLANVALRENLSRLPEGTPHVEGGTVKRLGQISYTHPVSLGGCLLESLDDITGVLATAEGEGFK